MGTATDGRRLDPAPGVVKLSNLRGSRPFREGGG
jgi:hypothetical protein